MPVDRLRRRSSARTAAIVGAIVVLVVIAAIVAGRAAAVSVRTVGAGPAGATAFEFVGHDDQPDLAHAHFYGYLTHLRGVADGALFAGAFQGAATARLTFSVDLALTQHIAEAPLFVTSANGVLTVYLQSSPGADFAAPASFRQGLPVLRLAVRVQDVLDALSLTDGLGSAAGEATIRSSSAFRLGGRRVRIGRPKMRLRIFETGRGIRELGPPVKRTIIAAGGATVAG
jgi:hypothetical protein